MARECFVFIQLPGRTEPTVAGRFRHEDGTSPNVGTFVYGRSYLSNRNAVPLDPVALPLREAEFTTTLTEGIFGVIRDALPDDWGRHVVQKLHGDQFGTSFDLLLLPSADRSGALSFGTNVEAPALEPPIAKFSDLNGQVLSSLDKIDRDLAITDAERRAAIAFGGGTHAGGARPKLTVLDDNAVWAAKLGRHDDAWNVVRVEAAMLDLAQRCQIRVPAHRVETIADRDLLLVKRFDRIVTEAGIEKHRVASAQSVFRADEQYARNHFSGSYMKLSLELARWGNNVSSDRRELYRRMAFNCLTGITDDHERNHSLVASGQHFTLAEAYDLSPAKPTTRKKRQAMAIGAEGDIATRANLLSAVARFDLNLQEASIIINDVQTTVAGQWRHCFSRQQVAKKDMELLSPCFDHEYFEGR